MSVTPELADRLNKRAVEVVASFGVPRWKARRMLRGLRAEGWDFCTVCYYKRKRKTGDPLPEEFDYELGDLEAIISLPQRDGDSGDMDIRRTHASQVLWAHYDAEDGLTDHELQEETRIFLDSAKGMRANLMKHGWIDPTGTKRMSWNDRPMEVWILSDKAREVMKPHAQR